MFPSYVKQVFTLIPEASLTCTSQTHFLNTYSTNCNFAKTVLSKKWHFLQAACHHAAELLDWPLDCTYWASSHGHHCPWRETSAHLGYCSKQKNHLRHPSISYKGRVPCSPGPKRWAWLQRMQHFTKQMAFHDLSEVRYTLLQVSLSGQNITVKLKSPSWNPFPVWTGDY